MGFFGNWFGNKASARTPSGAGAITEPVVRDFTTKPNIDPAALQKIMPRDGEGLLTVSGLDGVMTVGKDMLMTTDQPIRCQILRVLGTLEATVYAQRIIIAEGARVVGSVRVNDAEVRGEFEGSLRARGTAVFHSTAKVSGKVRALEFTIAKEAKMTGVDIRRVVPRVFDELNPEQISSASFDDGYSSMCMTVSPRSAIRRQ
ncbi:MAG: polymer-forming cytoskeletal protein [Rhizobacter sp.]|nr:polymer-forming cytoskeletal protein [Burkholderiales bacterium]